MGGLPDRASWQTIQGNAHGLSRSHGAPRVCCNLAELHPPCSTVSLSSLSDSHATARLAGLLDSAMDAIITVDAAQTIVLYNRAAGRIFGWPAKEVLGQPMALLLPERFRDGHHRHISQFASTGVTSRRMGDGTVIHGRRADGSEFPLEASISQLHTDDGPLFTVILRDVTERVRAQEELSAFAAQANTIREQEKTRVARELHDELAQSLTALKMDAIWLRDHLPTGLPDMASKLDDMLAMLDASVAATRRIAADLRPLMLDDLGLVAAIEWLAQNFTQRTKVPCQLQMDDALELHEPYATAVFRIVQESLANVAKHANASTVVVQLDRTPGRVAVAVRDNGAGFDTEAARPAASLGLLGVRERAQLLKGQATITSAPGEGTTVSAELPVRESGGAA